MTWMITIYLRAFVILLPIALGDSDDNGPFPGFKQQPVNTVIETSNQSIICQVKGEKPLKIYWTKNGARLQNNNYLLISEEGSLTIFDTEKYRDTGYYRCVVENKYGRIFSNRAHVTFPYINPFSTGSTQVRVNKGDKALLHCYAPESYPDRNIHWFKRTQRGDIPLQVDRGSHISISESGDLYFSYTTEADQGVYFCSVENNVLKRVLKRAVTLKIEKRETHGNIAPQVWLFENTIAMKDSNFILECIAYGRPVPSMKFRHDRSMRELDGAEQLGNRLRYEFGRYDKKGDNKYVCEVTNEYGEKTSKTAYVRMEAKPKFRKAFEERSVRSDVKVQLPCSAYGIPAVKYKWFYNGARQVSGSSSLTIRKVMKRDEGIYQCTASNRHGEALMTVHLKVVEMAPNFGANGISPREVTHAIIGGRANIFCQPSGAPKPKVTWSKSNKSNYIKDNSRRFIILPEGTLQVVNIKQSDAGTYMCTATNRLGTKSKGGSLLVTAGLAITQNLTRKDTYKTGEKIVLECVITSADDMEVYFTWKRGNRILKNRRRIRIRNVTPKISRLEIKNSINRDTGVYKCSVSGTKNRKDMLEQYIVVSNSQLDLTRPPGIKTTRTVEAYVEPTESSEYTDKEEPSPPVEVQTSEQNGISIKLSWTMGPRNRSPVTHIHIECINAYDNKWTNLKSINISTFRHRYGERLTLSPWTQYKFRVIAENRIGRSKPSRETSSWVATPPARPEKIPQNIKGVGIATNKIKVTFERLKKIDQNGPGIRYCIYYKAVGRSYKMIKKTVPGNQEQIILTFNNMDSYYRLYEFQLQAKNDIGHGPRSQIEVAYTGERTPLEVPRNLEIQVKPPTAFVEATWEEVSKGRQTMRGEFRGYKFLYWVKPKFGAPRSEVYLLTHSPPITVELRPFTEYYFQVLAYNNAGDGPVSREAGPIRTPEGSPSKPKDLMLSDASAGEATITWKEPEHKNGRITQYLLTYFSNPNGKTHTKNIDKNVNLEKVAGLSPKKEYTFTLCAKTNAGAGEIASVVFNFSKVPSFKLNPPIVTKQTHDSVVLQWTKPNLTISGYKVFYWRSDGDETVRWENDDIIIATINYLKPDRLYYFQVALYNQYGTGPKSEITQARTTKRKQDEVISTTHVVPEVTSVDAAPHTGNVSSNQLRSSTYLIVTLLMLVAILVPR